MRSKNNIKVLIQNELDVKNVIKNQRSKIHILFLSLRPNRLVYLGVKGGKVDMINSVLVKRLISLEFQAS